ncbi:MAG: glycoside hydrolase family 99-like domain-containing protein, partial [Pseudomonadota bacterium]
MLKPALHQCLKVARFLVPRWAEVRLQRKIAASGQFDRTFYRSSYLKHSLTRLFPIRHYVLLGERAGLSPRAGFVPHYYLSANPDVAGAALRPLAHYIDAGRREGRVTCPPSEVLVTPNTPFPSVRPQPRKAAHAIVVHVFYPDLWPEIAKTLSALTFPFDLFVTLSDRGEETDDLMLDIRKGFADARLLRFPNHGRDIYPLVHLIQAGALEGYRAVAKLHTKKSPHRSDGDIWRQHLVQGILPGAQAKDLLQRFEADPSADVWVADGQVFSGESWWGSNKQGVEALLRRLELPFDAKALRFPGGSIYWLKASVVSLIRGMALTPEDFTAEAGQVDGTTAHAMERAIGYLAQAGGGRILQTTELSSLAAPARPQAPGFVSAFYLPQFHPTPQNDAWWGEGYTEWQGVAGAKPNYEGHAQPAMPGVLGAYDLRLPQTMGAQYALARGAGIDAFCVYHYWFDGARLLEAPLDGLLAQRDIPFGFYL